MAVIIVAVACFIFFLFCLQCLPALVQLVRHDDLDVKVDACWALSFLADGPQNQIQAVIESQIIPYLVPKLQNAEPKIVMPALRTLGNIVTGSDAQTQVTLFVHCTVLCKVCTTTRHMTHACGLNVTQYLHVIVIATHVNISLFKGLCHMLMLSIL